MERRFSCVEFRKASDKLRPLTVIRPPYEEMAGTFKSFTSVLRALLNFFGRWR